MKGLKIVACAASGILLTGCASTKQVIDRNYLRAISITEKGGSSAAFSFYDEKIEYFVSSGIDIPETRTLAELKYGKAIFTGHTELIILGDCDFEKTLEILLNEWKVSPSCLVVYGGDYALNALDEFNSEMLSLSVKTAIAQKKVPECDIVTVLSGLLSDKQTAEVAYINKDGISGSYTIATQNEN